MTPDDGPVAVDLETALADTPAGHQEDLRLWLRLLSCANLIETEIRRRFRERLDTTLPRFDLMAQLDREPDGLTLGEISRRMMVSNGNVTALATSLVAHGLVLQLHLMTGRDSIPSALRRRGRWQLRSGLARCWSGSTCWQT